MKKKVIYLLLTSAVLTSALTGCGGKKDNANDNNTDYADTELMPQEELDTDTIMDTEGTTSQLQLGSAVEIPEGWDGRLAETDAHGQLEQVIADYCGVDENDYANVRYYYNYVDLNGDSNKEILALVLGQDTESIGGNRLLWIEDAQSGNMTKDSVKQEYKQVGAPVYISNHMTEGYRDLIIMDNSAMSDSANGADVNGTADNNGETSEAAGTNTIGADTSNGAGTGTSGADTGNVDTSNAAETMSSESKYILLVWNGEKYQELEEGTVLENLDNYEGEAILTNNMESDFANDNYHFLGEGLNSSVNQK